MWLFSFCPLRVMITCLSWGGGVSGKGFLSLIRWVIPVIQLCSSEPRWNLNWFHSRPCSLCQPLRASEQSQRECTAWPLEGGTAKVTDRLCGSASRPFSGCQPLFSTSCTLSSLPYLLGPFLIFCLMLSPSYQVIK